MTTLENICVFEDDVIIIKPIFDTAYETKK